MFEVGAVPKDGRINETAELLLKLMKHDKKNEGDSINFTLLGNVGDIRINLQATKDEIFEMLDFLREG